MAEKTKAATAAGAQEHDYEHREGTPHPVACEKRDSRLEPDGNEQRQEHQHERGPHRVDRLHPEATAKSTPAVATKPTTKGLRLSKG